MDLQSLRDIAMRFCLGRSGQCDRDWQRGIVITALTKQAIANFGTERLVDAKGEVFVPVDNNDLRQPQSAPLQGDIEQVRGHYAANAAD